MDTMTTSTQRDAHKIVGRSLLQMLAQLPDRSAKRRKGAELGEPSLAPIGLHGPDETIDEWNRKEDLYRLKGVVRILASMAGDETASQIREQACIEALRAEPDEWFADGQLLLMLQVRFTGDALPDEGDFRYLGRLIRELMGVGTALALAADMASEPTSSED